MTLKDKKYDHISEEVTHVPFLTPSQMFGTLTYIFKHNIHEKKTSPS